MVLSVPCEAPDREGGQEHLEVDRLNDVAWFDIVRVGKEMDQLAEDRDGRCVAHRRFPRSRDLDAVKEEPYEHEHEGDEAQVNGELPARPESDDLERDHQEDRVEIVEDR